MDLKLKGKVAIVTGGAKGIGAGISEVLANEGAKLAIATRVSDEASQFIEKMKKITDVLVIPGDVSKLDQCKKIVEDTVAHFGHLDILINNAGVNDGVSLADDPEKFINSLHINLVHLFALAHHSVPHLKKTNGNILNIGSKVSATGQGNTSGYAASKGGCDALTREWALDLRDDGVRVNCLIPAECLTPQYESWLKTLDNAEETIDKVNKLIPFGRRMTTIKELGNTAAFVCSDLSSHTTGQILFVDGGYTHLDRKCTVD
ncbi:MAG: SDR family oxidoreductase [Lentisphaeria bacterium]|nr:SDR family oxidoreductase [Lentisphaeria bacterium]